MMELEKKNFCKTLQKWAEKHPLKWGSKNNLAKKFGISRGQMSSVFAGRKCGDSEWRKNVASQLSIDYQAAIKGELVELRVDLVQPEFMRKAQPSLTVITNGNHLSHIDLIKRFKTPA